MIKIYKAIIVLMILVFVVGCAGQVDTVSVDDQKDTTPPVKQETQNQNNQNDMSDNTQKDTMPEEKPPAQEDAQTQDNGNDDDEPAQNEGKCNFEVEPQNLADIRVSFDDEGVKKDDQGLTFKFYPVDAEGNVMPIEGNIAVYFYNTQLIKNKREGDDMVYSFQKYIKLSDVDEITCEPKPVFISYEDMRNDGRFGGISEDDPGKIKVVFKRTGSFDEFDYEYMAPEGESLFPDDLGDQ